MINTLTQEREDLDILTKRAKNIEFKRHATYIKNTKKKLSPYTFVTDPLNKMPQNYESFKQFFDLMPVGLAHLKKSGDFFSNFFMRDSTRIIPFPNQIEDLNLN